LSKKRWGEIVARATPEERTNSQMGDLSQRFHGFSALQGRQLALGGVGHALVLGREEKTLKKRKKGALKGGKST